MKKMSALFLTAIFAVSCSGPFAGMDASSETSGRSLSAGLRLISAKTRHINIGSSYAIGVAEGTIEVENVSSTKSVVVHGSIDGGLWSDIPAYYISTRADGKEVWGFSVDLFEEPYATWTGASISYKFALKLAAGTKTWWDNNQGLDYTVATRHWNPPYSLVALGTETVRMEQARYGSVYPAGTVLDVEISVKNLAYAKNVTLVYTDDSWATVKKTPAVFQKNWTSSQEQWVVSQVINGYNPASSNNSFAQSVEFCISYEVNGVTYWDNNGGKNYYLGIGSITE